MSEESRILLRAPNWIGDAVLCLPAVEELKKLFPESSITVLAKGWTAPVFRNNPDVSAVLEFDDKGLHRGLKGRARLVRELKSRRFRSAVLFQNSFEAALLMLLSGIPERTGYSRNLRGPLLTNTVPPFERAGKRHHVYYYLNIVASLGGGFPERPLPKLYLGDDEIKRAVDMGLKAGIKEGALVAGAFPGASYGPAKRWPAEGFAHVLDRLSAELGAVPLLFGGKGERERCEAVAKAMKRECINLAGRLGLRDFMAFAPRLGVFITNDSGPMHIAASLGVPTLAVFGSTDPELTGPLGERVEVVYKGVDCSPCFKRQCPYGHYKCMTEITPDEVFDSARALLREEGVVN